MPYSCAARTVAETPVFQRYAADVWRDAERIEFINWMPTEFLAQLKQGVEDAH